MKIYNINQTNQINKVQSYTTFRGIPKKLITDTFEKITNPKNKAVYEQLAETFKDHKPKIGFDAYAKGAGLKEAVESAYKACLDSNGEVNDNALSTLFKLCYIKPDFDNPLTPIVNTAHEYLNSFKDLLTMWDGESKILNKTERCRTFRDEGLWQIAQILEACKDKNGNHNQINLDFANWIEKNCSIKDKDVLKFINACKDNKTGICKEENIQIFKDLYKQNRHYWFLDLPNEDGVVTKTALKFLNDSLNILEPKEKSETSQERYYYGVYLDIVQDALQHAHGENRDEILKLIYENRDLITTNHRGYTRPLLITADKKEPDDFGNPQNYNINPVNLKALIDCYKESSLRFMLQNFYLLKDKNGIVNEQNKKCLKILTDNISYWWDDDIKSYSKFKEAINEDWIFNIDFCKKFVEILKKHNSGNDNPVASPLLILLEYMKNKDNSINWKAVDIAFPLAKKYFEGRSLLLSEDEHSQKFLINLSMLMRDGNGDFCETRINKVNKVAEKYKDATYINEDELFANIGMEEVFEKAKDINLYKADEMYNFIKQLQSKGELTAEHFSTPIDEDGNTLLMYIADIPQNPENEYEYEQLLKILKLIDDIDYNQQDKFGITFFEKVINSENMELLKLMKNKKIKYNPMLDYAYNGVQNQDFKEELKKIKLIFPELEEAVRLNSIEAFERVKNQLYSPFCDSKKEVEYLLDIATDNKNFTILSFLKNFYMNM